MPLRMLARDWRGGELRVLGLALVIAVASVSGVSFFADRARQALFRDAHQLLGGDLLITADHPLDRAYVDEAKRRGLAVTSRTRFISMSRRGETMQLTGVKAVTDGYPLRGNLRIAPALNTPDRDAKGVPEPGTVWIDERLASALNAAPGSRIGLGASTFEVAAILTVEPDRGVSFFNLAPRLIMNQADLPATELIQVGSRVRYALLFAGSRETVDEYQKWAKAHLGRGERIQGLESARPEIRAGLERAQQFIGLTALLAVMLAAVAIGLATRRYSFRHLDNYAVMRSLGASQRQLFSLFTWEFIALGAISALLGCALGYTTQQLLSGGLTEFVAIKLPPPSLLPAAQGLLLAFVLLLGFALPPLMQLKDVPALRVLRRDLGRPRERQIASYAAGGGVLTAMVLWQAGDAKLGAYVLGGFAAAAILFTVIGYATLRITARAGRGSSIAWRYGMANLRRRAQPSVVQIVALGLGLTAILLLTVTRADLLAAWRAKTPENAPNRFVLNIQPGQRAPIERFLQEQGLSDATIYPMVRGRLVAINGVKVSAGRYEELRTKRLVEREFNLSFMDDLPAHNRVVDGQWFSGADRARGAFSVEEGVARTLGIRLGDRLTWSVGGRMFSAPVTSIRKLDWDSMQVNFFVIATPPLLEPFPTSYITSFHLPATQAGALNGLGRTYPNLTVVDISAILRQVFEVIEKVVQAVQVVFLFALAAGLLVLFAALLATEDERVREAALLRALGASRAQVTAAQRIEFVTIGLTAGVLGAAGAAAIGAVLADRVLNLPYTVNPWLWVLGPALGGVCVVINAMAGAKAALSSPPALVLRETE